MTIITILPHPDSCPAGVSYDAKPGKMLCDTMIAHGVEIEHACDMVCACSTCHIIVRDGYSALKPADDEEEDRLDKAWGLTPTSRLACQIKIGETPLTIEMPRYSLNHAREHD